ncbi:MAG: TolC family protein [Bacteroidales bacterium]|nr:TolC family protein [Bacteroidales bacterium]
MKPLILFIFLLFSITIYARQPDLNYFLEKAKENSPLINKSKNESIIADLDLKQIRSILSKPEINLESNILFAPIITHDNNSSRFQLVSEGADKYTGYDLAVTEGGQYQAVVSLRQSLFTSSKYKSYSDMTNISHMMNENTIALTVHETEQLVTYQYLLCLKSKTEVENSSSLLKELEDQLVIMKKLVENGIYKQTDLMLLQIEYQTYNVDYKTFQAEYRNNLYDLNLLCGIDDTSLIDIQDINLQLKSGVFSDSQFLTSFKLDSLNVLTGLAIEELKYKPEVSLFADAGLNAVYLPSFNRLGLSSGISFKMNLFDGNQRKILRDKATISLRTIEFEKNNFMTKNDIYKNKTLSNINSLGDRLKIVEAQIDQYKTLLEVYSKELAQGEISILEYKNLLKDIVSKKQESLLIKMDTQMLINSYNYWNY